MSKKPSRPDCFDAMKAAVPEMSPKEVRKVYDRLETLRENLLNSEEAMKGPKFREQVMRELEQVRFEAQAAQKQTIENALKLQRNRAFVAQDALKGDPAKAILGKIRGGMAQLSVGGNESAGAMATGLQGELSTNMMLALKESGLKEVAEKGLVERDLWQEVWEHAREGGQIGSTKNVQAQAIAKVINATNERLLEIKQQAGSSVRRLDGRVTRTIHDAAVLREVGADAWIDKILPLLDQEKTLYDVSPDKAREALAQIHHQIISGEYETRGFDWTSNTDKQMSQSRELHFKDGHAAFEYNQEFGSKRPLIESILRDVSRTSREAALMYHFGTNPEEGVRKLIVEAKKIHADDPEARAKLEQAQGKIEAAFNTVKGLSDIPGQSIEAKISQGIRAGVTLGKVGSAIFSVISDGPLAANLVSSMTGKSALEAASSMAGDYLSLFTSAEERMKAAGRGAVFLEDMNHQMIAQMGGDMAQPGVISRMMRPFGKLSLLNAHVGAAKTATVNFISRTLGEDSHLPFGDLHPRLQGTLSRYGIDAEVWDSIRKGVSVDETGSKVITHEGISKLGQQQFTGTTTKFDAQQKLLSFYNEVAAMGSTTATAREKAILLGGTRDEGWGSLRRLVAQFKAVPLQQLNTLEMIASSNPEKPARSWGEIARGKGDTPALATTMASMIGMAYVSSILRDASQGKTPKDPTQIGTAMEAIQRSGVAGLYGDFLLTEARKGIGGQTLSAVAGPGLSEITNFADLTKRMAQGDKVAGDYMRWLINNSPYHNLWFARGALDTMIFHSAQEWASPGSSMRKEQFTRKDGQDYFIDSARPTQRVRTFE